MLELASQYFFPENKLNDEAMCLPNVTQWHSIRSRAHEQRDSTFFPQPSLAIISGCPESFSFGKLLLRSRSGA